MECHNKFKTEIIIHKNTFRSTCVHKQHLLHCMSHVLKSRASLRLKYIFKCHLLRKGQVKEGWCIITMPTLCTVIYPRKCNPPFEIPFLFSVWCSINPHSRPERSTQESINPFAWQILANRGQIWDVHLVCAHLPSAYTIIEQIQV